MVITDAQEQKAINKLCASNEGILQKYLRECFDCVTQSSAFSDSDSSKAVFTNPVLI